jgi:hypothetical protein
MSVMTIVTTVQDLVLILNLVVVRQLCWVIDTYLPAAFTWVLKNIVMSCVSAGHIVSGAPSVRPI